MRLALALAFLALTACHSARQGPPDVGAADSPDKGNSTDPRK